MPFVSYGAKFLNRKKESLFSAVNVWLLSSLFPSPYWYLISAYSIWSLCSGGKFTQFFFPFSTEFLFNFHSLPKWKWSEAKKEKLCTEIVYNNRSTYTRTKEFVKKMPKQFQICAVINIANEVVVLLLQANQCQPNSCEHQNKLIDRRRYTLGTIIYSLIGSFSIFTSFFPGIAFDCFGNFNEYRLRGVGEQTRKKSNNLNWFGFLFIQWPWESISNQNANIMRVYRCSKKERRWNHHNV